MIHWTIINNKIFSKSFQNGKIVSQIRTDIPIGIYDSQNTYISTESFQFQNKYLHSWNLEIYLKLYFSGDIYFQHNLDYLVVKDIDSDSCGFLFDDQFEDYIYNLVLLNDNRKFKFSKIDDTYVYDNRIVIITNSNFNDIYKLSYYCKKLTISPFRLNTEVGPYQLLKNYIFFTLPNTAVQQEQKIEKKISGGLINCCEPGFHTTLYEYDIKSFYPNIIMKYLPHSNPIRILMEPLVNDSLKCLKLYIYGMLGSKYSILYDPITMDFITTTGRNIIKKYLNRAVIIATDAIFMKYEIIPDFCGFEYKSITHTNVFVISASQYFTDKFYRGFPKNILSDLVCRLAFKFINNDEIHDNIISTLLNFMDAFRTFPLYPIPFKDGQIVTASLGCSNYNHILVDKYTYLMAYRKVIYKICDYKSNTKLPYQTFKIFYNSFCYK